MPLVNTPAKPTFVRFIWDCRLRRGRILSESARSVMVYSGGGYFVLSVLQIERL